MPALRSCRRISLHPAALPLTVRHSCLALVILVGSLVPVWAQAELRVLAFGDSITFGLRDSGVDCGNPSSAAGFPPRLASRLATEGLDVTTRTSAVCGETTGEGLSRFDDALRSKETDVVVLMEGTNDISAGYSIESILFNLREMRQRAAGVGVEPVVASPIPRGPGADFGSTVARTGYLAYRLREETLDAGRIFAETHDDLLAIPNLFSAHYHSDGYHPRPSGYGLLADSLVAPTLEAADRILEPHEPCEPSDEALCFHDGRFRVSVDYEVDGEPGSGRASPLTEDTGTFWFFQEENVELVVKVLDGRCLDGSYWVFYGGLSTVEYRLEVVDTTTGRRRVYENEEGTQASVGETGAFPAEGGTCSGDDGGEADGGDDGEPDDGGGSAAGLQTSAPGGGSQALTDPCQNPRILCLGQGRFQLRVEWRTPDDQVGFGKAETLTADTGYFWFFEPENVELVVKVLDGTGENGYHWVFYGALTNLEYDLVVTDVETGNTASYSNPLGSFGSHADTEAFPGIPIEP